MKKVLSILLCLLLAAAVAVPAFADGNVSYSMSASSNAVYRGETITLSAAVSSSAEATSYGLQLSFDSSVFELVEGTTSVSEAFVKSFRNGFAFMFQNATAYSGTVGTVTLKVKENAPVGTYTISGAASVKNGSDAVSASGCSVSIKVSCQHSFGEWAQTKAPTCDVEGEEQRVCSLCNEVESKAVSVLGHTYGEWAQTVAPTCTEKGEEARTCTVAGCGFVETRAVNAAGHSYSGWTTITAATCEKGGEQERTCSVCQFVDKRQTSKAAHVFQDPVIVKEATLSSTGLMQGKCKNCSATTDQIIPCTAKDSATGIVIEAEEGVFSDGTQTDFAVIDESSENYASVQEALAEISGGFNAYQINFVNGDADVAPNGQYTMIIPFGAIANENLAICYINAEGVASELEYVLNDDGTVSVVTEDTGIFVVADKSVPAASVEPEETEPQETEPTATEAPVDETVPATAPVDNQDDVPAEKDNTILLIILLILIIIGVVSYIFYRRRR